MKICPIFLKYDYGDPTRGESGEKKNFLPALQKIGDCVPFWLEDAQNWCDRNRNTNQKLQKEIIEFVMKEQPSVVVTCLMEYEIFPETLKTLVDAGIIVVNWFCDDQWRFEWSRTVAPSLSYAITTDKYSLNKYNNINVPAILASWGADFIPSPCFRKYRYDVSFVGGKNDVREWFVNNLRAVGLEVQVFGHGWNEKISDEDMKKVFLESKINLNLSNSIPLDYRFHIGRPVSGGKVFEQIKARHFEIPASYGFQLSQYAIGVEDYFEIGKEIAVYNSIDELYQQILYYLENEQKRETMRHAGWLRSKNYTYEQIFRNIFEEIMI